ncbi:MAG: acetolactate synthase small subunit [Candidatus Omnitrophica bacterium]|nr:acetolactate synthase small subunit [Candidatus Omnitrophota bacterium]
MKHTISVMVENHFGVLAHVAGLFSARGFNIDSLTVGETQDPTVSRMTITVTGDDRIVEQIVKQLDKLIDVIKVEDITNDELIERELVLVKVGAEQNTRNDVMQVVNTFRAKVVDVNPKSLTIEVTGGEGKIDAMLELLRPLGILEVVRTGMIAMARRKELEVPPIKPLASAKTKSSKQAPAKVKAEK